MVELSEDGQKNQIMMGQWCSSQPSEWRIMSFLTLFYIIDISCMNT